MSREGLDTAPGTSPSTVARIEVARRAKCTECDGLFDARDLDHEGVCASCAAEIAPTTSVLDDKGSPSIF